MNLPPWDEQTYDFTLIPENASVGQCSRISITTQDRSQASVPSTKPYAVTILAGGYVPHQANIALQSDGSLQWVLDIPLGIGPHVMYMTDAKGYTGGVSIVFDMTASSGCSTSAWTPNQLSFSVSGDPKQCGTMAVTINNGTAPYKFQAIVGVRPPKTTRWSSSQMTYVVDLNVNEKFFLVMTDAKGNSAVSGIYTVGAGGADSCSTAASTLTVGMENMATYSTSMMGLSLSVASSPDRTRSQLSTSSSTSGPTSGLTSTEAPISTGALVGAVVGSIAFFSFLIGLGLFLYLRRRRSNKETKGKGPPVDLSADEKAADEKIANEKIDRPGPAPSIFSPFEYQPPNSPPNSPREISEYSRDSVVGGRSSGSSSSQARLFAFDHAGPSNNRQSMYSTYSRGDTISSSTQWARSPVRNSGVESYPQFLAPPVPPERENRRLVPTFGPEPPSSPISFNPLGSDATCPPPYSAIQ